MNNENRKNIFMIILTSLIFSGMLLLACADDISDTPESCGSGTGCHVDDKEPVSWRHTDHLTSEYMTGIRCTDCHYQYDTSDQHMNGTSDTKNLIAFQSGTTTWNDASNTCSNISCHPSQETHPVDADPAEWTSSCSGCH